MDAYFSMTTAPSMSYGLQNVREYLDAEFIDSIKAIFESDEDVKNICENALRLFEHFVLCDANPNLSFPKITIGKNIYTNPTCLHVAYILWKYPNARWNNDQGERFSRIIEAMLKNRSVNLLARFSENKLNVNHFVNRDREKIKRVIHDYYVKENIAVQAFAQNWLQARNSPNISDISAYPLLLPRSGDREYERKRMKQNINDLEGHTLEQMTIAHFAILCNDSSMLNKVLALEPRLLREDCCMTKGKSSLGAGMGIQISARETVPSDYLDFDRQLSGDLLPLTTIVPYAPTDCRSQLFRRSNVTLLHLAARVGSEKIFACLQMKANPAARDSAGHIPKDYLQYSILEKIVVKDCREMLRELNPNAKFYSALPEVNLRIHHEGYDLLYDTSRKVAYYSHQKLYRDSVFGSVSRPNGNPWHDYQEIPALNRPAGLQTYGNLFDRGHFTPAEDQSNSVQAMWESFFTENQAPQHQNLNRGYWSRIEDQIRRLTLTNELVEIYTGPLFNPKEHRMIGDVIVPSHFFKIIYLHNRRSTYKQVVLAANVERRPNSIVVTRSDEEAGAYINLIQNFSGILFSEWRK